MYITRPPIYTYICRRVRFYIVIFVNFKSIYTCIYSFTTGLFINHGPLKLRYSQTSAMAKTLVLISMHNKPADKMFSMFKTMAVGVVTVGGLQMGQCIRPCFSDLVVKVIVRGAMDGPLGVWQTQIGSPCLIDGWYCIMMMSSNGNIFCVTGPLWGESTGSAVDSLTQASDAELQCFIDQRRNIRVSKQSWRFFRRHRAYYDVTFVYACMHACAHYTYENKLMLQKKQCFSWGDSRWGLASTCWYYGSCG